MEDLSRIVLLIDADNTKLTKLEDVIREISAYGRIVVKRAYGNWRKDTLKHWESELKRLAIKAEQQFDYVTGKNATDMALVIDAVNLLHTGIYDAFVIVTSDSDFTPLAIHLHESGVYVMGVGARNTPESFRNSCDEFVYLENIGRETAHPEPAAAVPPKTRRSEEPAEEEKPEGMKEIHKLLLLAAEKYQDEEGLVFVSFAGNYIKRAKPDFDLRSYGFTKLSALIAAFPDRYELVRGSGDSTSTVRYRCKALIGK